MAWLILHTPHNFHNFHILQLPQYLHNSHDVIHCTTPSPTNPPNIQWKMSSICPTMPMIFHGQHLVDPPEFCGDCGGVVGNIVIGTKNSSIGLVIGANI
jgi:hypothetical protein